MERSTSKKRIEVEDELNGPGEKKDVYSCKESLLSAQARLSVAIPRGVYKKLKLLAHDREMTVSALLLHLIKAELQ
jgi:predicted DNA-binding ribbon-helix-helix protein